MGDSVDTNAALKNVSFTSRFLDVLYEIKFKLAIKKIEGKLTIAKSDFKKMIEDETTKDIEVKNAIAKLFEPLNIFSTKKEDSNDKLENNDEQIKNVDSGQEKGMQMVLAKPGFKTTSEENNE